MSELRKSIETTNENEEKIIKEKSKLEHQIKQIKKFLDQSETDGVVYKSKESFYQLELVEINYGIENYNGTIARRRKKILELEQIVDQINDPESKKKQKLIDQISRAKKQVVDFNEQIQLLSNKAILIEDKKTKIPILSQNDYEQRLQVTLAKFQNRLTEINTKLGSA